MIDCQDKWDVYVNVFRVLVVMWEIDNGIRTPVNQEYHCLFPVSKVRIHTEPFLLSTLFTSRYEVCTY